MELTLSAEPRNLDVHRKEADTRVVELTWQPPRVQNGRITGKSMSVMNVTLTIRIFQLQHFLYTGYIILYTNDETKPEREWSAEAINGDKHSCELTNLLPSTKYYFKIQARNSRGYGPFSKIVSYTTGEGRWILNCKHD